MPDVSQGIDPQLGDTHAEALRRARRLLDISVALNTLRDPQQLLLFIIETATEVLDCGAASLLLFDKAERRLRFAAATGEKSEALAHIPVPLNGSIAGTIFCENRPLIVGDTQSDSRHFDGAAKATGVQTEALLGVPMRISGEPIGVFEVLNPASGSFTDDDVETLLIIAAQAAVAIENVRQRRDLAKAHDRLAKLDQVKSDFMALASHELRTPLSIILGFGDVLRLEADPSLSPFVEDIMGAGNRMQEIIETLEEMSAVQDDATELVLVSTVLQDIIREAWAKAKVETRMQNAQLELPEAALRVEADPRRLRFIFVNLLKNALAFTPEDGTVRLRLHEEEGHAFVRVSDSGIGLSQEDCTRVFEAFHQVENHLTRGHEGMGMGLTVAKGLAHLHQGQLWATSDGIGQGSTFHVRLPLGARRTARAS